MKLDIVLRTCSKKSITPNKTRIVSDNREDLILKCVKSLIKSIQYANQDIKLTIIDDHSDQSFLDIIKSVLPQNSSLIQLEGEGFNVSAFEQFKLGFNCEDWVYFVEDDYLHSEDAIYSMIKFIESGITDQYRKFNGIALYPYDCPHRYWFPEPSLLFYHNNRYWRTIKQTAFTVMLHSSYIKSFWGIFESMALNYPQITESDAINLLFTNLVDHGGPLACFSPIPSVAYHISYENEPPYIITDRFLDYKKEWGLA